MYNPSSRKPKIESGNTYEIDYDENNLPCNVRLYRNGGFVKRMSYDEYKKLLDTKK